jgi:hypothetical protein
MLICAIISWLLNPGSGTTQQMFSAKLESFQVVLAVFARVDNRFGLQKNRYRSRHPDTSVPFSLFDFL